MENDNVYTLIYDVNGGTGGPESQTKVGSSSFVVFETDEKTPSRPGYVFSGWSFTSDGSGSVVFPGDMFVSSSKEKTIYAIWTKGDEIESLSQTAEDETTEPLGVFSTSTDSSSGYSGEALAFSFILSAIVLGLIAIIAFRIREPRIISKEEDN